MATDYNNDEHIDPETGKLLWLPHFWVNGWYHQEDDGSYCGPFKNKENCENSYRMSLEWM